MAKITNKLLRRSLITLMLVCGIALGGYFFLRAIYVPPILTYHSIDGDEQKTKLSLSAASFALQMEYLYKNKYKVISLAEMADLIRAKKRIPHRTVTITFDDGFRNNYLCAYPILKRYGFPATFFVVVGWVGSDRYMTWDDLKELSKNNITVGSHTMAHHWLPSMDNDALRREIYDSKKILEDHLGSQVLFLAYPLGAYDDKVKTMVKEAGYAAACGTNPGKFSPWEDLFALKRIKISRTSNSPLTMWFETSGYYTFVKEFGDKRK